MIFFEAEDGDELENEYGDDAADYSNEDEDSEGVVPHDDDNGNVDDDNL